jgi:hypothetical protein
MGGGSRSRPVRSYSGFLVCRRLVRIPGINLSACGLPPRIVLPLWAGVDFPAALSSPHRSRGAHNQWRWAYFWPETSEGSPTTHPMFFTTGTCGSKRVRTSGQNSDIMFEMADPIMLVLMRDHSTEPFTLASG